MTWAGPAGAVTPGTGPTARTKADSAVVTLTEPSGWIWFRTVCQAEGGAGVDGCGPGLLVLDEQAGRKAATTAATASPLRRCRDRDVRMSSQARPIDESRPLSVRLATVSRSPARYDPDAL
jgi:hypothetical protein